MIPEQPFLLLGDVIYPLSHLEQKHTVSNAGCVYLIMCFTKMMKPTLLVPLHKVNVSSQTSTVVLVGV
jgi:hypothetical protein